MINYIINHITNVFNSNSKLNFNLSDSGYIYK